MRPIGRTLDILAALVPALLLAACDGDGRDRTVLTVYSPHGKALLSHYEQAFEVANPDVDVQWLDMGSREILDRLRAEQKNPQADIWFGAPTELFQRAANEGLLEPFEPTWKDGVPPSAKDIDGRWYGTYLTAEVVAYNTQHVSEKDAPRDWDAVADPRWKGHVVLREPVASGTMRAIFGALLQRSLLRTGRTDSAWSYLSRLDANTGAYSASPESLYTALTSGDGWITLYNMPDIADLVKRRGAPVAYLVPSSGTPLLIDAIALVKGTRNKDAATRFVEFVTTPLALKYAADSLHRMPARSDIADSLLPQWVHDARIEIRPMPLDARLMADSLEGWMRTWDQNVRRSRTAR